MSNDNTLDTTVEEWQAEMERITPNDSGRTLSELSVELKVSATTMQRRITQLINEGKCIRGTGRRFDCHNRPYDVTVYQLIPQEKATKQ